MLATALAVSCSSMHVRAASCVLREGWHVSSDDSCAAPGGYVGPPGCGVRSFFNAMASSEKAQIERRFRIIWNNSLWDCFEIIGVWYVGLVSVRVQANGFSVGCFGDATSKHV